MKKHYISSLEKDYSGENEWLIGHFFKDSRRTDKIELKYWKFDVKTKKKHAPKLQKQSAEITILLKGKIRGYIENSKITLSATEKDKDYVFIPAGLVSNLVEEVLEDAEGITIKAPSTEYDTLKLDQICKKIQHTIN